MIKPRNIHLVLALAAVAVLPGCSDMFGNHSGGGSQGSSAAAATAPQPVANEMVRQVQERLKNDGYYKTGAVDGVWGSGTMTASGQLDVPTLRALNVANTGSGSTGSSSANTNSDMNNNTNASGTQNSTSGNTNASGNYNANSGANMNAPANPNAPANSANTYPDNRSYNGQSTTGSGTGTSTGTGSNAPR